MPVVVLGFLFLAALIGSLGSDDATIFAFYLFCVPVTLLAFENHELKRLVRGLQKQRHQATPHTSVKKGTEERGDDVVLRRNQIIQELNKPLYSTPEKKSEAVRTMAKKADEKVQSQSFRISYEDFFGKRFFAILGVISLVIGIGYFTVWALENGLIGPLGRVSLGALTSLALMLLGEYLHKKHPHYSYFLTSAGIAGLVSVTYVAHHVYFLIGPFEAFALYVLEVALGMYLSLRYDSRVIGNFATIGGFIIPLLIQSDPNPIGLLSYLFVLSAAGFGLSLFKKWYEIPVVTFLGYSIFAFGSLSFLSGDTQHVYALLLTMSTYALLASGGIIRGIRGKLTQTKPLSLEGMTNLSGVMTYELVIMCASVLTSALMGYLIFDSQQWDYFSLLLLAEAVLFYGLHLWLSSRHLFQYAFLFEVLALVALPSAIFMEFHDDDFVLVSLLISYSLVLSVFGERYQRFLMNGMARLLQFLLFLPVLSIIQEYGGIWKESLLSALMVIALCSTSRDTTTFVRQVWRVICLFFIPLLVVVQFHENEMLAALLVLFYCLFLSITASTYKTFATKTVSRVLLTMSFLPIVGLLIGNNEVWKQCFLFATALLAFEASSQQDDELPDNPWRIASYVFESVIVVFFAFLPLRELLEPFREKGAEFVSYLFLSSWALLTCWVGKKKSSSHAMGAAGLFLIVTHFFFLFGVASEGLMTDGLLIKYWLSYSILIITGVSLLTSYSGTSTMKNAPLAWYPLLIASSLSTLTIVFEFFDSPYNTIIFALWGIVLMYAGMSVKKESMRYTGIGVLLIVISKMYLIDLWLWDVWMRFIAFGTLGVALLFISFFYHKKSKE